ncbi:hypothetical protein [Paenarthrobacter sp. NPDC090522]
MLATFSETYERGVFFDDAEGFLDMDFDVFWELARELNPEAGYWKL